MKRDRNKELLRLRTIDGLTLQEIGNRYGLSKQRVQQIVRGAKRPAPMKRSKRTVEERFYSRVRKTDYCWEWTGCKTRAGYGRIRAFKETGDYAHRLAWVLEYGHIPDGMQVCHKCDNPSCVNPAHLFLGRHLDNMADMRARNRSRRGAPPNAILDPDDVRAIRDLLATERYTQAEIGSMFGVSRMAINSISTGRSWSWL